MRFIITLFVLITILSTMDAEPILASEYRVAPFERCIQAFEGSERVTECEALRL